jgi:prevent-host-death family protein
MNVTVFEARDQLEQLIERVQMGQRIVIGKPDEIAAALISIEDWARLEQLDAAQSVSQSHSLANTVLRYHDPFEPVAHKDWLSREINKHD